MKYVSFLLNWRIDVVTILAAFTLLLAMCDSDSILVLFVTKVFAIIFGYATHMLFKRWEDKMPELGVFNDDEDIAF